MCTLSLGCVVSPTSVAFSFRYAIEDALQRFIYKLSGEVRKPHELIFRIQSELSFVNFGFFSLVPIRTVVQECTLVKCDRMDNPRPVEAHQFFIHVLISFSEKTYHVFHLADCYTFEPFLVEFSKPSRLDPHS